MDAINQIGMCCANYVGMSPVRVGRYVYGFSGKRPLINLEVWSLFNVF